MQSKNLDGIKRPFSFKKAFVSAEATVDRSEDVPKNISQIKQTFKQKSGVFRVDSIVRHEVKLSKSFVNAPTRVSYVTPFRFALRASFGVDFFSRVYNQKKVPILVAVVALFIAFGGGMWAALNTTKSSAQEEPQVLGVALSQPLIPTYSVSTNVAGTLGPINSVPNDVLFNMTIAQLENYLTETLKTPEVKQAEILALRKIKLKAYLEEKKSPLSQIVNTLAELKHWKVVLAVSNSESSLGKRCYENNCSGIGVEPGHPLWRSYETKAEWAKDLDKLLERRYKDWTLEDMNGVYNQPGSKNWLLASKQILEDLEERKID